MRASNVFIWCLFGVIIANDSPGRTKRFWNPFKAFKYVADPLALPTDALDVGASVAEKTADRIDALRGYLLGKNSASKSTLFTGTSNPAASTDNSTDLQTNLSTETLAFTKQVMCCAARHCLPENAAASENVHVTKRYVNPLKALKYVADPLALPTDALDVGASAAGKTADYIDKVRAYLLKKNGASTSSNHASDAASVEAFANDLAKAVDATNRFICCTMKHCMIESEATSASESLPVA